MRKVTMMLVPLPAVYGVLLEIVDEESGDLFRKRLTAPHHAIREARGYVELSFGQWRLAEESLQGRAAPFVISTKLLAEVEAAGQFANYMKLAGA